MNNIAEKIKTQNDAFREALIRKNLTGLTALYTEDARVMPPNSAVIKGSDGVKMFGQGFIAGGLEDIKLTSREVVEFEDVAIERGDYWLKMAPEGQPAVEDEGKYVVLWKKTPDGWKLHWDIFNTNLSP